MLGGDLPTNRKQEVVTDQLVAPQQKIDATDTLLEGHINI
jgi:hypothetical protein